MRQDGVKMGIGCCAARLRARAGGVDAIGPGSAGLRLRGWMGAVETVAKGLLEETEELLGLALGERQLRVNPTGEGQQRPGSGRHDGRDES
jgi:hypothetical protein